MSILIKGMEMPKDYSVIVKIFPDGRVGTIPYVQWFKVDLIPGTQAIPVPPHGRLIDSDALRELAYQRQKEMGIACCIDALDIVLAPTIIPAEEGET